MVMEKKSGGHYRRMANERVKKYRQAQIERGYKNLSIFCSLELRAEFERLKTEKGFNKQESIDYIFNIYRDSTYNSTCNKACTVTEQKEPESTASVEHTGKQPIKEPEIEPKKSAVIEAPDPLPESIPDTAPDDVPQTENTGTAQRGILDDEDEIEASKPKLPKASKPKLPPDLIIEDLQELPDCHGLELSKIERDSLFLLHEKLYPSNESTPQMRADRLNKKGILRPKGTEWNKSTASTHLSNIKKKIGEEGLKANTKQKKERTK